MASYDSDSSLGEGQDFTETDVLLGYASKEPNGETISRLGGRPDWLEPGKPPSASLARCKACNDMMALLLQLNAELPNRFPTHERRLYVFSCRRKACRRKEGSVRALRGVRVTAGAPAEVKPQEAKQEKPATQTAPSPAPTGLGEALFGVKLTAGGPAANTFSAASASANPFSRPSPAAPTAPANPFAKPPAAAAAAAAKPEAGTAAAQPDPDGDAASALPKTFAETLSLNNPQTPRRPAPAPAAAPEPWPAEAALPAAYAERWLSEAEYEALDPTPAPRPAAAAAAAMEVDGGGEGGPGREDKEVFESSMDATFQRFADRVGQNPEQCIRYEFAGQPLLYSKSDAVGRLLAPAGVGAAAAPPRCGSCGAARVFEVQMTPRAIEELEGDEAGDGLDGMDWGTIIVAVCERDCLERAREGGEEVGYVEEWAGVQWEELAVKR